MSDKKKPEDPNDPNDPTWEQLVDSVFDYDYSFDKKHEIRRTDNKDKIKNR